MVTRLVVIGLVALALAFAVRDGRLPHVAGLIGSCQTVQTEADGTQVETCVPGRLEGAPDLSRHGCTSTGWVAGREVWRCPAALVASPADR